jgi:hypothetical protein
MAKIWTDGCVNFETEEEARENALESITWDDLEEHFQNNVSFHDFFTKVRENMPNFFDLFEDEWYEAENEYFNNNYWEEDNED